MAKRRDRVDFVIGVDTHKATHTAAVVNLWSEPATVRSRHAAARSAI